MPTAKSASRKGAQPEIFFKSGLFDEIDNLLNREETAALLADLLHSPVAIRTVAAWPIAYRLVGHRTLYRRSDVEGFAAARLSNAPRCIGRVSSPASRSMA